MIGTDPKAVGPRIRMALPSLTPLEAKVVESVFKRNNFDETTSIKEVAEGAGVSEAMVAKISKKLGFTGFRDFRAGVAEYIRLPTADFIKISHPKIRQNRSCRRFSGAQCKR